MARRMKLVMGPRIKIARNALCPCGSGKKFKHCCLNWGRRQVTAEPQDSEGEIAPIRTEGTAA